MRLLDRYLLRELLLPLAFCLGGFLILWIAFDLFAELPVFQRNGLGAAEIAQFYLITAPQFLAIVLPVALLLALLYALTQHARHHELTAMRAAGISLWRLSVPYFGVGLTLSLGLFAVNEWVVPDTDDRAEALLNRRDTERAVVRNFGFTNARENRKWTMSAFNLETGEMTRPQVRWTDAAGEWWWLFAAQGRFTNGCWTFTEAKTFRQPSATNAFLEFVDEAATVTKLEFRETPEEIRSEVRISGGLRLRKSRSMDIPVVDLLDYLRLHPTLPPADHAWLHTKLHGRLASPC
jgi:lipopolysaccharide export LptBFGC system permease protein LptF